MTAAGLCLALEPFDPLTSKLVSFCGLMLGLALVPFIAGDHSPRAAPVKTERVRILPKAALVGTDDARTKDGGSFIRL